MSKDAEFCITDNTCHLCYKTLSGKSQLYRHLREVHKEHDNLHSFYEKSECIYKCLEGCEVSFRFNRDLRRHLNDCHNFNIEETTIRFAHVEEFQKWFIQEQETGAQFIKHRGATSKQKKITYFSCNRSGISKPKIDGRKRQFKKCGTRKINAGCTSYLKLEEKSEYCEVIYCDFHYGHKIELEHLPIPFESRAAIVNKLANGAKLVKIDLKKKDVQFESIQRSQLLTRSDLKSLRYFSKSQKARFHLSNSINGNGNDLEKMDSSDIFSCIEPHINKITNNNEHKFRHYNSLKEEMPGSTTEVKVKREVTNNPEEIKGIQEMEVQQNRESKDILDNVEIHYVDDGEDRETHSETEEDVFGYYVAEMLKQINPNQRLSAKDQINDILQSFLIK